MGHANAKYGKVFHCANVYYLLVQDSMVIAAAGKRGRRTDAGEGGGRRRGDPEYVCRTHRGAGVATSKAKDLYTSVPVTAAVAKPAVLSSFGPRFCPRRTFDLFFPLAEIFFLRRAGGDAVMFGILAPLTDVQDIKKSGRRCHDIWYPGGLQHR